MQFSYLDSIIDIWGRLFLLAIVLVGGAIPSIKAMRGNGDNEPLSRWAWLYIGVSAIAFIVSAHYMILDNKSNKLNEYTNQKDKEELKESFEKYKIESNESFTRLERRLTQSIISDSTLRADLKNQGYKYYNGKIINTQINTQKVGTNYGILNQFNGDFYSLEKLLTPSGMSYYLREINKALQENNSKCISFSILPGSNGGAILEQLKEALNKQGFDMNPANVIAAVKADGPIGLKYDELMHCLYMYIGVF